MKFIKKFRKNGGWGIIFGLFFLIVGKKIVLASDYEINNFEVEINLNQDYSLTIKEKIETNFLIPKHGIYRVIPYIYNNKGKTIKADLRILKITDVNGGDVSYQVTNYNQSKKIKIGDSEKTIIGQQEYVIEYEVDQVVLDYGNGPEIYWNVTGDEWDVAIEKSSARVISNWGEITKTECFNCEKSFSKNQADFKINGELTVVVQIDKNNQLKMPGLLKRGQNLIEGNWGYLLAILPTFLMGWVWFKKGRDKKYLTENIYYKPENKIEKNVPLLSRPHLPLVYSPIDGLSPAEVGTIIDERVDIKDIVAEIVELARLGYLTIKKIELKGIFGIKNTDYELIRSEKKTETLNKFQKNLLRDLFDDEKTVKISDLKNHFYSHLKDLKNDLYDVLVDKKMADKSFDKVKNGWLVILSTINSAAFIISGFFLSQTANYGPMIITVLGIIPTIILAVNMPRKTAWGYSLHRQAVGLKYYLEKGKWREEIMEKNLFLEEMLPIAISLGVVKQLAKDMKDLGVEPPKYFEGVVINNFAHDLNSFSSSITTNLTSTPSGNSSWSGGSGFSGGSSGGGFGGGGGGSW